MDWEDRYDSLFQYYADKEGFGPGEWLYFKAQVKAESSFNPDARSRAGAIGLAQFMPNTWKEWRDGTPGIQEVEEYMKLVDPRDPEDSIRAQVWYMKWLLARFDNHWPLAWAAYNWGIGNVRKLRHVTSWIYHVPQETRSYVSRIKKYHKEYVDASTRRPQ